eukprot:COSAG01_NODE_1057_length_11899_cov_5.159492_4_plen_73_part_00
MSVSAHAVVFVIGIDGLYLHALVGPPAPPKQGVDGAEVLARALRRNRALRTLNLGVNAIGDEGAWELASGER